MKYVSLCCYHVSLTCLVIHSKQKWLEAFSTLNARPNRRASATEISILQQAVKNYDPTNVHMSLAGVVQAAYSHRWNNMVRGQQPLNGKIGSL